MKIEELFPGAVVLHPVDGPITVTGYNKSLVYFSNNQGQWPAAIDVANLAPVPIKPKILLRLEGENGERFEQSSGGQWMLVNSEKILFKLRRASEPLHTLQTRVRLDAGIILTLKPE